jgi:hypothetical protein
MGNAGRVLGSLCVAVALGVLIMMPAESQVVSTDVGMESILEWDHDCLDIGGGQEMLTGFEVAISADDVDLSTGSTIFSGIQVPYPCTQCGSVQSPGCLTCAWPIQQLLQERSPGTYRLWVRAFDWEANVSDWSDPLTIRYRDSKKPSKPSGLRCR